MPKLSLTCIDVGWGDSLFLEFRDGDDRKFALIDSNDTTHEQSSLLFLKKYFKREGISFDPKTNPAFEFVLLTHAHADHAQGLKTIIKHFGSKRFLYSKSVNWGGANYLMRLKRSANSNVQHHESVHTGKGFPPLNGTDIKVLWPHGDRIDPDNENNNSVVLAATLGNVCFVLSGDAEEEVWEQIALEGSFPPDAKVFKVPHHGSANGTFDAHGGTPWLDHCTPETLLAVSAHPIRNWEHPSERVLRQFTDKGFSYYRTDEQYHLTFNTDGSSVQAKYSHI